MKTKLFSALAAFGLLALSGIASADGWDPKVTLWNESGFTITEFYMSPTAAFTHDLLGAEVLESGYHTTVRTQRGRYNVKLVDEDDNECFVEGVNIDDDRRLTVTQDMLSDCEGWGRW